MYIVDGEKGFRAELKHPKAEKFSEAIGFSIYSNRKNTVDFFKSVFEMVWNERKLNEELIKASKIQNEFINVAAHELRTPIVPILGISEILRSRIIKKINSSSYFSEQRLERNQVIEMQDIVIRNADRLRRLTEDILDVTKIESQHLVLKKERFDLNEAILSIVHEFERQIATNSIGRNIKIIYDPINFDSKTTHTFVEADKSRVNQVISNLLSNAIKFSKEEGGTITVITDIEQPRKGQDHIIVSVTDTGTGIDQEIMPKLFSKFVTKSYQGTGLGLYISRSIVEAHGGKIWARNNGDGKGATFSFTLSLYSEKL